jgi:hypothetical protein
MRDLVSDIHPVRVLSPQAARTDNTAAVGQVVDGFGYDSVSYIINVGANTDADATFAVLLEESDASGSGFTAVADADLIGTEAAAGFTFDDDNELRKIGYRGAKRYTRLTVTPSANDSGNIFVSAVAILGHPRSAPTPALS